MTNMTMQDATAALTKLADDVEVWHSWGLQPHVPDELLTAAERLVAAMKPYRDQMWIENSPVTHLILVFSNPDEEVTAPLLKKRFANCNRDVSTRTVSVALNRAAERGHFQRLERGKYRLVLDAHEPPACTSTLVMKWPNRNARWRHEDAPLDQDQTMS